MITTLLKKIPLFSNLPEVELERLARSLSGGQVHEGTLLLEEGGRDERCFIVVDGSVEVIKALGTPDEHLLGVRGPGSLLGEMSLFTLDGEHTATVRAQTEVSLLEFTRSDLNALLQREPNLAYEIIGLVSRRLEESEDHTILDLREKNALLAQAYDELKAAQAQIIEREKLQHELDIAREIQLSFLPPELPRVPGYEFGAMMIPARSVGGDLYDFIPVGEQRLGIVVGDVSDKGVPAALFMALTFSLLRAEAARWETPGEVLRSVNRLLLDMNSTGMFVTLLYGVLDCQAHQFTYARAGHPYPLLLDSCGESIAVPPHTGQVIGLLDKPLIDEGCLLLPQDSVLCLFTDGLTETVIGPDGEQLEAAGAAKALAGWCGMRAGEQCRQLWRLVQTAGEQQDDFTVVVVKREGA